MTKKNIVIHCNGKTYTPEEFTYALIHNELPANAEYSIEEQ